jgi:hypothetical protein
LCDTSHVIVGDVATASPWRAVRPACQVAVDQLGSYEQRAPGDHEIDDVVQRRGFLAGEVDAIVVAAPDEPHAVHGSGVMGAEAELQEAVSALG